MKAIVLAPHSFGAQRDGGRAVVRNEIVAMSHRGVEIDVISFARGVGRSSIDPDSCIPEVRNAWRVARRSFAKCLVFNPLTSFQVASRRIGDEDLKGFVQCFPDAIISHQEWTLPAAAAIRDYCSDRFGRTPLIVLRRHNDELKYYRSFGESSGSFKSIFHRLELARISRGKVDRLVEHADEVWSFTDGDSRADSTDVPHFVIPPALFENAEEAWNKDAKVVVGFLGSLDHDANLQGLRWFLDSVWPIVQRNSPEVVFRIMGRGASRSDAERFSSFSGVEFIGEVDSTVSATKELRVFVNPVFIGSGINIKMGEPLRTGVPIVTTSFGARGFDKSRLTVADDERGFAEAVVSLCADQREAILTSERQIGLAGDYTFSAVGDQMVARLRTAIVDGVE